jgi:putative glutamine amidotransferase
MDRDTSPLAGQPLPDGILDLLQQRPQLTFKTHTQAHERPSIVVPGYLCTNQNGRWPILGSDGATMQALQRAGANPLSLPSIPLLDGDPLSVFGDDYAFECAFDTIWSYVVRLNVQGLCMPGGGDLYSCLYYQLTEAQTGPANLWWDLWERYLLLIGWLLRWPTLGICRGMQHMNIALGGGLIQDLRAQWPTLWKSSEYERLPLVRHTPRVRSLSPETFCPHDVFVDQQSLLARILQVNGIAPTPHILDNCLSQHHQAVGIVMPDSEVRGFVAHGLRIGAIGPDGVIEALESQEEGRWWVGVQYHPEWMFNDHYAQLLFRGFAQECYRYRPLSQEQLLELGPKVRAWVRQVDLAGLTAARQQRIAVYASFAGQQESNTQRVRAEEQVRA